MESSNFGSIGKRFQNIKELYSSTSNYGNICFIESWLRYIKLHFITPNHLLSVSLLNRQRPGELQRSNPEAIYNITKSLQKLVLYPKKVLFQKFKQVVIREKMERGVPVLFSLDVQEHINILSK